MEDDLFLQTRIDDSRMLCVSSISRKTFDECAAENFQNDRGYFIYECSLDGNRGGISVLAKMASFEAAFRFYDIICRLVSAITPCTGATADAPVLLL